MNRGTAWTFHLSTLLVAGTGLVYAWMLYLLEPVDEFSILNHPRQALLQHAHIWSAPLMIFALGMIWRGHVWRHVRSGRATARRSGLLLIACLVPMAASGYFLQTSVSQGWRDAWMWIHLVSSGFFLCGYLVHQLVAIYGTRREPEPRSRTAGARGGRTNGGTSPKPGFADRPPRQDVWHAPPRTASSSRSARLSGTRKQIPSRKS